MALLELKNIGKIYVSEGSIAVGIRGVSLSFDRGEFVAVTGKSGSGKSTLLNVISGMDSYEEGEMNVEGNPTSHYLQKDWEEYREKYISFIFQDYNIIDSFTVLQNVELALMSIRDTAARRRRAVELIKRVGLEKQMHHKGSKLSGGQKQRTVIARALAKDSPIILADEPTGNLDSQTSEEIVALLKEISADKLVIVVTHDFAEFAGCATRHVRIFDGSVESDHATENIPAVSPGEKKTAASGKKATAAGRIKDGFSLGWSIFSARPRLTVFICLLLLVGTLGIYLISSNCSEISEDFEKKNMFTEIDGRVIITKQTGEKITDEDLKKISDETGAVSVLRPDYLLDMELYSEIDSIPWDAPVGSYLEYRYSLSYGEGKPDVGRYPEKDNEVLLRLPISYKPYFGSDSIKIRVFNGCEYESDFAYRHSLAFDIVGLEYYSDNNIRPTAVVTENGLMLATANFFLMEQRILLTDLDFKGDGKEQKIENYFTQVSVDSVRKIAQDVYVQASVFYKNNRDASEAVKKLRNMGYIAVTSDVTYLPAGSEIIDVMVMGVVLLIVWASTICFLGLFINLCTMRSVAAFKPDMAIMRSMGIPVLTIKTGIYIRMMISLIPSYIAVVVISLLNAFNPAVNAWFPYMYFWQYLLIAVSTLALVIVITARQIRKLFGSSVKKSIRGGDAE